ESQACGLELVAVRVPPAALGIAERLEPRLAARSWADERPESLEHEPAVACDRNVRNAIPAQLARVSVDVDQRRRGELAVPEPEVERGTGDADDVGLGEGGAAGGVGEGRGGGRGCGAGRGRA